MCGIVGGITNKLVDEKAILSHIAHRGPDSEGFFQHKNLFLGHTRLSIQDLSENGSQPMYSEDKNYVIIFNGEIYNHLDVREKLKNKYTFKSTGDTETILYAFIEYGEKVLNMLNGIFAFAIYNFQTNELFICRDQLGVKPLYIYKDKSQFLFSSELKSFLYFDIDKTINIKALANYLTFLWTPGNSTPMESVVKLASGHFMWFKIDAFEKAVSHQYYDIPFHGEYSSDSEEKIIDQLESQLIQAVKRQMLSDVPVGFFLSGGLDSSLIVAIALKLYPNKKLECFTIEAENKASSEGFADDLFYAKKVAEHLNVHLHIVKADINIVKDFDKMIWHLDEPLADAAPLNVYNICKEAKKLGIKVLLGGTAGDDLFSGYRRHQAINLEKYIRYFPKFLIIFLNNVLQLFSSKHALIRRMKKVVSEMCYSTNERLARYFMWLPEDTLIPLFHKNWQPQIQQLQPARQLLELNKNIPQESNLLNRMLYWELKTFLVDHNLNYTDKMSMATGIEVRVPFLDLELIQFSVKIPLHLKMKGNETKYILKKVAERYLPKDVIYRPKTGFGAPVRDWITKDLDKQINDYLSNENIKARGIFDTEKVWQLINDNKSGKIDASYSIWALLAIESWMRQFMDSNNPYETDNTRS